MYKSHFLLAVIFSIASFVIALMADSRSVILSCFFLATTLNLIAIYLGREKHK